MTTGTTGTKRRTLLQRGVALLAGGAALAGTTRWAGAASPPTAAPPKTLTLYARVRPAAGPPHGGDSRVVASGDLLDAPDGERIGTFYSNCFCQAAPFAPQASNLEVHVLQLKDGTLFSIGSGVAAGSGQVLAIVGGTASYAGRSGSYVQRPYGGALDDVRQLTVTFAG